jgi:molecular chaperone Hsp33
LLAAEDVLDGADAENWRRAVTLLETADEVELMGPHVGSDGLLLRLFHEEAPRVFAAQSVQFGCTCAPEKVVASLAECSADEIAAMTTPEGLVTADCQFCGAHYAFDPEDLGAGSGDPAA